LRCSGFVIVDKLVKDYAEDIMGILIPIRQIRVVFQANADKEKALDDIISEIVTQLSAPDFRFGHP
jgi:hypothetical protein